MTDLSTASLVDTWQVKGVLPTGAPCYLLLAQQDLAAVMAGLLPWSAFMHLPSALRVAAFSQAMAAVEQGVLAEFHQEFEVTDVSALEGDLPEGLICLPLSLAGALGLEAKLALDIRSFQEIGQFLQLLPEPIHFEPFAVSLQLCELSIAASRWDGMAVGDYLIMPETVTDLSCLSLVWQKSPLWQLSYDEEGGLSLGRDCRQDPQGSSQVYDPAQIPLRVVCGQVTMHLAQLISESLEDVQEFLRDQSLDIHTGAEIWSHDALVARGSWSSLGGRIALRLEQFYHLQEGVEV